MGAYQEYIHKSRYARFLPESGRREHFPETVDRYLDFMSQHYGSKIDRYVPTLRQAMLDRVAVPSMRAFWSAGPALMRNNMCGYNCLTGETPVTTKEYGIVPIETVAGKSVHVIDGKGEWVLSPCRQYGESTDLYEVQLGGKAGGVVRATGDHRWILETGETVTTRTLQPGARLASAPLPEYGAPSAKDEHQAGFRHGFVYGDGTSTYSRNKAESNEKYHSGFLVRVCSYHDDITPFFEGVPCSYPPSFAGDPVYYLGSGAIDLKALPDVHGDIFSDSYLRGFVDGLIASDGGLSSAQIVVSGNIDTMRWLAANGPRLGVFPGKLQQMPDKTNYGKRSTPCYRVGLNRRTLPSEALTRAKDRARYSGLPAGKPDPRCKVNGVTRLTVESPVPVYCFSVPTTQSFVLNGNLLTGNCSFVAVDNIRAFSEALFILMCGTGVGFSCRKTHVEKLPRVPTSLTVSPDTIVVEDSREGWAQSVLDFVAGLYAGKIRLFDVHKVRKAGTELVTMGGRASGPAPLLKLVDHVTALFMGARGRQLTSRECHSIMCMVGEIVVVGGVRRSALISLSDLHDEEMRVAKSGQWWEKNGHYALANNSVCYEGRPDKEAFDSEWAALVASFSGERGVFNLEAARSAARESGRDASLIEGTNPCAEILLRSMGLCNLSEHVIRPGMTAAQLIVGVEAAAVFGTLQAGLTYFPGLRSGWVKNAKEEALLGVSLTGIMDHAKWSTLDQDTCEMLAEARAKAREVNAAVATDIGIRPAGAVTTVKPSGTVSQLMDCASGMHARFAPYYIRRVRQDIKDPICQFMLDSGFVAEDCAAGKPQKVFEFYQRAPEGCKTVADEDVYSQLDRWKKLKRHWADHSVSATIYVRGNEWDLARQWVWQNFDTITGVSFLPYSGPSDDGQGHSYVQAPYEAITAEQYEAGIAQEPSDIDWDKFEEGSDLTAGSKTLACVGGACEL